MKIAIISIYSFPDGLAATNRIKAYAKGLIRNGVDVKLYIPFPPYSNNDKIFISKEGVVDSISYCYTSKIKKSKYKIIRAIAIIFGIRKCYGYITTGIRLCKDNNESKIDCLIVSTDELVHLWAFSLMAKYIKAKAIFIFDEFPTPIRHQLKNRIPGWKSFLYSKVLYKFDAYVSISKKLKAYYCSLCNKSTFILSSITDTDRFNNIIMSKKQTDYICYMGNMELAKDNVDLIIKSFALFINKTGIDCNLFLYGQPNVKDYTHLNNLIIENKLSEKVFFKGKANFNEVPEILCNAKLLVSSQPDTLRASGGFPTKLGEYLMSGVPVLLTDVGENSLFVSNNKQVFFAKPGSIEDFAFKMEYVFNNYDLALCIANEGKNYVLNNYSHIVKGYELKSFINELIMKQQKE